VDLFISNGYEEGDQNGKKGQKLQLLKRLHLCEMTASTCISIVHTLAYFAPFLHFSGLLLLEFELNIFNAPTKRFSKFGKLYGRRD